jgi:hypothetical protein
MHAIKAARAFMRSHPAGAHNTPARRAHGYIARKGSGLFVECLKFAPEGIKFQRYAKTAPITRRINVMRTKVCFLNFYDGDLLYCRMAGRKFTPAASNFLHRLEAA